MRAARAGGQLGARLACACCACLLLACSSNKTPPSTAEPKAKEEAAAKSTLEVPSDPPEPELNQGLDQLAEPAVLEQEEMLPVTTSSLPPAVVLKANELALRMLQDVEPARANLILAPITTLLALEMTLPGARGKTAQELERSLGLNGPQAQLVAKELKRFAASPGAGNKLQLASGLYTDEGLTIQASFERELRETFHASRLSVPFTKNPEAARARINQDVAQHTGERLKELLTPGSVDSLTRAVLLSAVAMVAQWKQAFDPARTQPGTFERRNQSSVQVPFMERTGSFSLGMLGEDATVLELPYSGDDLSMVIVLPSGDALPKEIFDADTLGRTLERLATANVLLKLPRFTAMLDSTDLIPFLRGLGVQALFGSQADLSGIAGKPGELYVSHVLHGAFVDVNEKGTEAAGATAVAVRTRSAAAKEPPVIQVNKPFLFLIRQMSSGLILFAGRIGDPSLKP
jgi:serpin B